MQERLCRDRFLTSQRWVAAEPFLQAITQEIGTKMSTDTASGELMERILYEVKRVVVGQDRFLERVMVALLAEGICWWKACPDWPKRSR